MMMMMMKGDVTGQQKCQDRPHPPLVNTFLMPTQMLRYMYLCVHPLLWCAWTLQWSKGFLLQARGLRERGTVGAAGQCPKRALLRMCGVT